MRRYLVTESYVLEEYKNRPGVVRKGETREELPPNAKVLTREQVENAVRFYFGDTYATAAAEISSELFGEKVG